MSGKSDQKSNVLKNQAERFSKSGEFYDAFLKLNKSLCLAENPRNVGELFAIRARYFYEVQLYQKCLNNVKLARKYSWDHKNLIELEQQSLAKNLENVNLIENPWDFFKLSHPANPKLPYVIDALEVKCDKKYGRFLITNKDLEVGNIVAIEKPFFKILKSDPDDAEYPQSNAYHYCANCLTDNLFDLIPCGGCSQTMFCSDKCQELAWKSFHKYECRVLTELDSTEGWRMSLRSFFDALSICDDSIEELEKLTKECDELKSTVFNFDLSDENDVDYEKNRLRCLLSLTSNIEIESRDFKLIFNSCHTHLKKIWKTHSTFITSLIERLMKIEILNFHSIKGSSLSKKKTYRAALGDGAFIFCSLVNHSCVPNVMRVVVDGNMVMIVERPIKQGEQLFDCYIG
jgi:SET and MYND domain-containing protein 4